MSTAARTQSGLPRRVIVAAAILSERFGNPEVAAYNRARDAGYSRRGHFWHSVGRALYRHPCGCPTNYELAIRQDIHVEQQVRAILARRRATNSCGQRGEDIDLIRAAMVANNRSLS